MSLIRDRIVEFRRVLASELRPHPHNWRMHPASQRAALTGVLHEIGYADALIARRCADGVLELIDGHLRAEATPEAEVPVLVVDLDEREAALLLAVHDPLAAMAETDEVQLRTVLSRCTESDVDLQAILGGISREIDAALGAPSPAGRLEPEWSDSYQIVVECGDERRQRAMYERLTSEGLSCHVLTL